MTVVLTGATGFLGSRVLRELLARDSGETIAVLGRGTPEELSDRVRAAVSWLDPALPPGALDRLRPVTADLGAPGLGLAGQDRALLARDVSTVWHLAADTSLQGDPAALYRVNVRGTRAVLELADELPGARLVHVSTAYVAGRRATGRVMEDDLSEEHGFATYYHETKYTAERLVRSWAEHRGRAVTVLRPSLLVTDRAAPPGVRDQPAAALYRIGDRTLRAQDAGPLESVISEGVLPGGGRLFRIQGDPRGSANVIQVEYAATAMARVAAAHAAAALPGVTTVHVTHPRNTSLAAVKQALRTVQPNLRVVVVPSLRTPTPYESMAVEQGGFLLGASGQRRTYDRTNLLNAVGDLPGPRSITGAYLVRVFRACLASCARAAGHPGPGGRKTPAPTPGCPGTRAPE
ncbi:SDR family oxidoreductase [Streptomyces capparidis]